MDFYHRAGLILDSLDQKKGSVKGLCMTEGKKGRKEGEGGRFLKIVIEVLKYRPHLQHLLTATKLLTHEPTLFVPPPTAAAGVATAVKSGNANAASKALMKAPKKKHWERPTPTPTSLGTVMLHDLLFAKRGLTLPKEHKVRKKLEKYKEGLEKENEREKRRRKVATNEGLQIPLPEKVASSLEGIGKGKKRAHEEARLLGEESEDLAGDIRWLRINTLRWNIEAALEWFEKGGWVMHEDIQEMLAASQASPKVFALDAHIEPLLALPSSVSLPTLSAYQDGRLLAQDKASCMPAWVLMAPILADADEGKLPWDLSTADEEAEAAASGIKVPKKSFRVMDATAAPGNKTTMAAALVASVEELNGKVTACERDLGRFKVLKDMLKRADAKNVQPMNVDFLSLNPEDPKLKNITHLLVDPSCSGSGIPSRLDHLIPATPEAENLQRIRALSNFQVTIVSHALRFAGAKRVVYSTCSVWEMEDEGVVMRVLAKKEFQEKGWRLAPREEVVPGWERRGRVEACGGDASLADSMVRALPEDGTNGFFVACFVKDDTLPPLTVAVERPARVLREKKDKSAVVEVDAAAEVETAGAKGGKKTKSSGNQAARKAKEEVVGAAKPAAVAKGKAAAAAVAKGKKVAAPVQEEDAEDAMDEDGGEDWEDEEDEAPKKKEKAAPVPQKKAPVLNADGSEKPSKKMLYLAKKEEVKRKKAQALKGQ